MNKIYYQEKRGRQIGWRKFYQKSEKKCSKCKSIKSMNEFHNDKTRNDGKCAYCKSCKVPYNRAYLYPRSPKNDQTR